MKTQNNNTIDMQNEGLEDACINEYNAKTSEINALKRQDYIFDAGAVFGANWQKEKDKAVIDEMFLNMQYYMEYCERNGYVTPQEWIEKHKHF